MLDSAAFQPVPTTADAEAVAAPGVGSRAGVWVRQDDERMNRVTSIPFFALHLVPLLAYFTGVTTKAIVLGVVLFYARLFCITGGYHRYFSHRSYKTNRAFQFVLAFGGGTSVQKGALWWAAHHREHHRNSDGADDIHSPQRGFWWSHWGWILCDKYAGTAYDKIKDFARYPELVWLNKYDFVPPGLLAGACFLYAGWSGLLIGFVASTVALWHATFAINSLAHVFGRRRYATEDTSRNSLPLALLTCGEGWHNNHHSYQASVRQGFYWWEIDLTYYVIKTLSFVRITHSLKVPTAAVREANRLDRGSFDIGMFRNHWNKASRAVHEAQASVGQRVHDVAARGTHAADAMHVRRDAIESSLATRKAALEGFVHHSLDSAEELAKLGRKSEREMGMADS